MASTRVHSRQRAFSVRLTKYLKPQTAIDYNYQNTILKKNFEKVQKHPLQAQHTAQNRPPATSCAGFWIAVKSC